MSTVGLVLGAGGTPGGAFIRAALAQLKVETGWTPEQAASIVGTSVGALNAGRLATHPFEGDPTPAQVDLLNGVATALPPPASSPVNRVLSPARLVGGRVLARFGPQGTSRADYDVATGPFRPGVRVVSVSRRRGQRRVAELHVASSPTEELYASAAIPGFAIPRMLDGQKLVDGAVWSTTNADLIDTDAAELLIVIAPMVPRSGGNLLARLHRAQLATEVAPWVAAGRTVMCVLPPPDADRGDDHKAFAMTARSQIRRAADRGRVGPEAGDVPGRLVALRDRLAGPDHPRRLLARIARR